MERPDDLAELLAVARNIKSGSLAAFVLAIVGVYLSGAGYRT